MRNLFLIKININRVGIFPLSHEHSFYITFPTFSKGDEPMSDIYFTPVKTQLLTYPRFKALLTFVLNYSRDIKAKYFWY